MRNQLDKLTGKQVQLNIHGEEPRVDAQLVARASPNSCPAACPSPPCHAQGVGQRP